MKLYSLMGFWVFYAAVHPAIIVTALLCGLIVCLFHWGSQLELSLLDELHTVNAD